MYCVSLFECMCVHVCASVSVFAGMVEQAYVLFSEARLVTSRGSPGDLIGGWMEMELE